MADNTDTSTEQNEAGKVCETCGTPEKTALAFERERKASAEKDERIEALSEQALSSGIAAAGFELTVADESGQARENKHLSLVVSKWLEDNPQVEEFDPEAFTKFASEYGVQPAAQQAAGESGGQAGGEPSAAETQAEALASMHQQGENLRNASTQPTPTGGGLDDQIREAEQAGDAETVKRLNNRKVSQMLLDTAGSGG